MENIKSRNIIISIIFTIIFPPLGHIYTGQLKKAFIIMLIILLQPIVLFSLKIPQTPLGLVISLIINLIIYIVILYDIIHTSRKLQYYSLKKYNKWYYYVLYIFIFLFLIIPIVEYTIKDVYPTARSFYLPTGSMEPTLQVGDHIISDLTYYRDKKPQRGDIVFYHPPSDETRILIHRCIAVEGDDFHIDDDTGNIIINNNILHEEYIKGPTSYRNFGKQLIEGKVPSNSIIILGDNRNNAQDSRSFGYISINRVVGKPLYISWSKEFKRIFTIIK